MRKAWQISQRFRLIKDQTLMDDLGIFMKLFDNLDQNSGDEYGI